MRTLRLFFIFISICIQSKYALAAESYELTINNGSGMPVSPAAVYFMNGQESISEIGMSPSAGLVQLCQMGNPAALLTELQNNNSVSGSGSTKGPILPGQSKTILLQIAHPEAHSVHIVAMYGKTKDACVVIDISSDDLLILSASRGREIKRMDRAIVTGAFLDPAVPVTTTGSTCLGAATAVDCLRTFSSANSGSKAIRFFPGYLPSVLSALEKIYGAEQAQSLLLQGGAVSYKIRHVR